MRITHEGQLCRKCNTPVIKRYPKKKQKRSKQPFYYKSYLYCPKCRTMYMVESEKVFANGHIPKKVEEHDNSPPDEIVMFFAIFREVMNKNNILVDIQKQIWEEAKKEYGKQIGV